MDRCAFSNEQEMFRESLKTADPKGLTVHEVFLPAHPPPNSMHRCLLPKDQLLRSHTDFRSVQRSQFPEEHGKLSDQTITPPLFSSIPTQEPMNICLFKALLQLESLGKGWGYSETLDTAHLTHNFI